MHPGCEGRLAFPEAFVGVRGKHGVYLKANQTGKSEYFLVRKQMVSTTFVKTKGFRQNA